MAIVLWWSSGGFGGLVEVNDASVGALDDVEDDEHESPFLVGRIKLAGLQFVHLVNCKGETDDD